MVSRGCCQVCSLCCSGGMLCLVDSIIFASPDVTMRMNSPGKEHRSDWSAGLISGDRYIITKLLT